MVHDLPKSDGGHHQQQQQQQMPINPANIPFHLLFPTPIPEPPRVVPSKPMVSDVSITSDFASDADRSTKLTKTKVKFKTANVRHSRKVPPPPPPLRSMQTPPATTTTIHPTDECLQRLRREHGMFDGRVNDNGYSSDEEEDNSVICLEEKSSNRRPRPKSTSNHQNSKNSNNAIQKQMNQVQNNLRQQFEKLKPQQPKTSEPVDLELSSSSGVSSDSAATATTTKTCTCNKTQQVPSLSSSALALQQNQQQLTSENKEQEQQMLAAYIRKQDQQLQQISRQIEELLRFHKHQTPSQPQTECLVHQMKSSSSSPKRTTTTKSIQTMTTESIIHETTEYRPLPNGQTKKTKFTTAKLDANKQQQHQQQKTVVKQIYVPSGSDYLDSSIEKARRELKQSLMKQTSSSDADESSVEEASFQSSHFNEQDTSSADMYTNMISTINSILVRNGSFESSSKSEIGDSTGSGSGNRSSCSEPEQNTSSLLRRPLKTSSPKQQQKQHHKRTTIIRQTKIAASFSKMASPQTAQSFQRQRYLHSEQSLYIEQLASKYKIHDEEEEVIEPPQSPISEMIARYHREREYDQAVYCLSDHNTSIATKDYLERHGLTQSPPSTSTSADRQRKASKPPSRGLNSRFLPLVEEDEENLPAGKWAAEVEAAQKRLLINKPKAVREVKSRTAEEQLKNGGGRFSRILDLEAIKSLPKLT